MSVAGALIGSLNFYSWALMIQKIVDDSPNKTGLLLRFLFKYGLVGVLVAATIFIFRVSPLGFAVGISNVVLALVIGGVARRVHPGNGLKARRAPEGTRWNLLKIQDKSMHLSRPEGFENRIAD